MIEEDYQGSDVLTKEDLIKIEHNHEKLLEGLHLKVKEREEAMKWLNSNLGKAFQKYLAAEKLRSMKECAIETDPIILRNLQITYAAVNKVEVIMGAILTGGIEALTELNQQAMGDTNE